jgi:hypothetical protein
VTELLARFVGHRSRLFGAPEKVPPLLD